MGYWRDYIKCHKLSIDILKGDGGDGGGGDGDDDDIIIMIINYYHHVSGILVQTSMSHHSWGKVLLPNYQI